MNLLIMRAFVRMRELIATDVKHMKALPEPKKWR
jgi:hypothetical protein